MSLGHPSTVCSLSVVDGLGFEYALPYYTGLEPQQYFFILLIYFYCERRQFYWEKKRLTTYAHSILFVSLWVHLWSWLMYRMGSSRAVIHVYALFHLTWLCIHISIDQQSPHTYTSSVARENSAVEQQYFRRHSICMFAYLWGALQNVLAVKRALLISGHKSITRHNMN